MFKVGDKAIEIHSVNKPRVGSIVRDSGWGEYPILFRADDLRGYEVTFTSDGFRYVTNPEISRLYPLTKLHRYILGVDIEKKD